MPFEVIGIAWSQVAYGSAAVVINCHATGHHVDCGARAQAQHATPAIVAAGVMALAVAGVGSWIDLGAIATLVIQVVLGAAIYLTICWAFDLRALHESLQSIRLLRHRSEA